VQPRVLRWASPERRSDDGAKGYILTTAFSSIARISSTCSRLGGVLTCTCEGWGASQRARIAGSCHGIWPSFAEQRVLIEGSNMAVFLIWRTPLLFRCREALLWHFYRGPSVDASLAYGGSRCRSVVDWLLCDHNDYMFHVIFHYFTSRDRIEGTAER
jgi:hypothetical protein